MKTKVINKNCNIISMVLKHWQNAYLRVTYCFYKGKIIKHSNVKDVN